MASLGWAWHKSASTEPPALELAGQWSAYLCPTVDTLNVTLHAREKKNKSLFPAQNRHSYNNFLHCLSLDKAEREIFLLVGIFPSLVTYIIKYILLSVILHNGKRKNHKTEIWNFPHPQNIYLNWDNQNSKVYATKAKPTYIFFSTNWITESVYILMGTGNFPCRNICKELLRLFTFWGSPFL